MRNLLSLGGSGRSALIVVGGLFLAACSAQAGSPAFDPAAEVALPEAEVQFANINPAIQMGAAWGDRAAGEHGTFGKFPANFTTPMHSHSGAYHGVVLEGVMTNPFGNEADPPHMAAGSYWYVPAGAPHTTACVSETPCRFYFHAVGAFDFLPVE